jgi:hypothetical protein
MFVLNQPASAFGYVMPERKTEIVPVQNGAILYLIEGGRQAIALTLATEQDAKIIARTWVDSIPPVVKIPQPTLSCVGKFPIPAEHDSICMYCHKKWIEH